MPVEIQHYSCVSSAASQTSAAKFWCGLYMQREQSQKLTQNALHSCCIAYCSAENPKFSIGNEVTERLIIFI